MADTERDRIAQLEARVQALEQLLMPGPKPGSPLVNLLSQEPGTEEEKREWLDRELPLISAMAEEDHPEDRPRRMAAIKSRVIRHWRQHLRSSPRAGVTIRSSQGFDSSRLPIGGPSEDEVNDLFQEAKEHLRG